MDERPLILDPGSADGAAGLAELRASGTVWRVVDTLDVQLRDLAGTRARGATMTAAELDAAVAALLDGTPPDCWGRWVFYPWSGRLVHVLPPDEFRELRLDRNRYKVTADEAKALATISVGVAGLSVGNAVALTLALEGSFGWLRLADHDRLDLSNMNRIRAGIHDIGVPKTHLAARQIWEIDPYARLSLFDDGVTAENVDGFLDGLDVLVDECDSLYLKFLMRERARARRLPVLMETSDRGLLDVERFDLDPDRPLFHGLVGDLTSEDVRALDVKDRKIRERKAVVVARILDAGMMSTRLAASMLEMDSTISTWPQLASDVALGGASATIAVRRFALGRPLPSGRRYVDLERMLAEPHVDAPLPAADAARPAPRPRLGRAHPDRRDDVPDFVRALVAQAVLAPSGGNAQPWHFHWGDGRLWVTEDRARARSVLDSRRHATWLALGAAIENVTIAAAARGLDARVTPFPVDGVVAVVDLDPGGDPLLAPLLPLIAERRTNRALGPRRLLGDACADDLAAAAAVHGADLQLVADADALAEVGRIVGASDRVRFLCPDTHRELVGELRWSAADAERHPGGITLSSLALDPGAEAAMMLLSRPDVAAELRRLRLGKRLEAGAEDSLAAASAAGLLAVAADVPAAWLSAGRALQRLWLEATARQVALQPLTVVLYLFELADGEASAVFDDAERALLAELDERLYGVFRRPAGAAALLFRLARVDAAAERSLRLPVDAVLSAGAPAPAEEVA